MGPFVAIQIDRQSLRIFSQADIDRQNVDAGNEVQPSDKETTHGQES